MFLDIETDGGRELTVVGFYSSATGLVQLVGDEITPRRLQRELPRYGRLYTFNGHAFYLARIEGVLGVDLRARFDSWDLRWVCRRCRIHGSQKKIERRAGFNRDTSGLDGWDAVKLWWSYLNGNEGALRTLLAYNAEDIEGLRWIKGHLANRDLLWRE